MVRDVDCNTDVITITWQNLEFLVTTISERERQKIKLLAEVMQKNLTNDTRISYILFGIIIRYMKSHQSQTTEIFTLQKFLVFYNRTNLIVVFFSLWLYRSWWWQQLGYIRKASFASCKNRVLLNLPRANESCYKKCRPASEGIQWVKVKIAWHDGGDEYQAMTSVLMYKN